ncbi:glycosyltransferase, partial [Helicobacter typhlonius]
MSEKFPLVSIITIVYNDKNHIKETMDSVVGQDYERLEYIIIDGNSKDGTKECIQSYISTLCDITHKDEGRFYMEATHRTKANFAFKFLSERDSGIYDAMNKGIDLATGEWCNFMNCGDRFYDLSVLRNIAPLLDEQYGVIDGGVEIVYDENYKKIKYYNIVFGPFKIEFCHHQASFIQTHLLKKYLYDKEFKIRGEIDFFSKVFINNYKWKKIQTIIATYNT